MIKYRVTSVVALILVALLGFFIYSSEKNESKFAFRYGLDLVGGTELVYVADTTKTDDVSGAMESLKEVIERRVNIFGVSEPLVQTESAGIISGNTEERLIVELPGVTDIDEAIALIGQTPTLEFRLAVPNAQSILENNPDALLSDIFTPTGLTGQYLERARVEFDPTTGVAIVGLNFNKEGGEMFAQITRENVGRVLAILLDGVVISAPVIQDEITDGVAQITGQFTPEEAKALVRDLNYGALPIPIELATSQTIGATLGEEALDAGVQAGVIGLLILFAFMIVWYRVPGVVASLALVVYTIISLVIFKLIPVTLTSAGVAGFILSVGMAVDANILIFERTKEELKKGRDIRDALKEGFSRAWLSIRDSNISSIITSIILFWIGTSAVKGFALTLGIGILVSMFTAITVSRTLLFALAPATTGVWTKRLFSSGIFKQ